MILCTTEIWNYRAFLPFKKKSKIWGKKWNYQNTHFLNSFKIQSKFVERDQSYTITTHIYDLSYSGSGKNTPRPNLTGSSHFHGPKPKYRLYLQFAQPFRNDIYEIKTDHCQFLIDTPTANICKNTDRSITWCYFC